VTDNNHNAKSALVRKTFKGYIEHSKSRSGYTAVEHNDTAQQQNNCPWRHE